MSKKKKMKKKAAKKAPGRVSKKPAKGAAKKSAAKPASAGPVKPVFGEGRVSFALSVKAEGLDVILGSAYLMIDRYFVRLDGDRKKTVTVTLLGRDADFTKDQAAQAAELFAREVATQRVRWQIARENLPVREYIQEQAIRIAQTPASAPEAQSGPGADELSEDQRKEIDSLIAEVESEIQSLKKTPAGSDPKKISASWEEKHKAA